MTVPAAWEAVLERFDAAWQQGGSPPDIRSFLAGPGDPRLLLIELIKIDLECRWRRTLPEPDALPARPRLEHYLAAFPELGKRVPADLIGEEYRVRRAWGDQPGRPEYLQRFGLSEAQAAALLDPIDRQLAVDGPRPSLVTPMPTGAARPELSARELLETLRGAGVLTPDQVAELEAEGRHATDVKRLAAHLLESGWTTPFQTEMLLKGRGADIRIGPYLLLDRIGQGWSSHVFRARHVQFERMVALKILRKELVAELGHDVIRRFFHEMQAIGRVNHPRVVHAYDGGPIGSTYFLAMEYVEGIDLERRVRESGRLTIAEVCDFGKQIAEGLQAIHEQRLVHRDIKPSNLILSRDSATGESRVKILDLGFARLRQTAHARSGTGLTNAGDVLGSADYLAPEQALHPHGADHRADLYGLGCTLYFLLCGQPPFAGGTFAQKLDRHQNEAAPPLASLRRDVPVELATVVMRLLEKQPEDRFQTAAEVVPILARLGQARLTRRRLLLGIGAAAAGGLVMTAGLWAILRRKDASRADTIAGRPSDDRAGTVHALEFDGVSQFVRLPDNLIDSMPSYTAEMWFRTAKGGVLLGCQGGVWPDCGTGFAPRFYIGLDGLLHGGFWSPVTGHTKLIGHQEVNDQHWHHAALVVDPRGIKLFQDGELAAQVRGHVEYESLFRNQLGAGMAASDWPAGNGGPFYFEGRLREFRLWNVARTPGDIRHTMKTSLTGKERGLRAYYPMDAVQGDVLVDHSWNRSDGLLGGGDPACRPRIVEDKSVH